MFLNTRDQKKKILTQVTMLTMSQLDQTKQKEESRESSQQTLLWNLRYKASDLENSCCKIRPGALFQTKLDGKEKWYFLLPWEINFPCLVFCDQLDIVEVISCFDERFKFFSEKKKFDISALGNITELH